MDTPQQKKFNILLVGDDCVDVYQFGNVNRISPEAPVPVFTLSHEDRKPGMAGNVANNLEVLGCQVNYLHGETSIKTRLIDIRSKQQIVRVDKDIQSEPLEFATKIPNVYDAVVVSDYNKGTVSYELIEELIELGIPIFIDTKKTDLARMQGAWVKINELEYSNIKTECSGLIVTLGSKGAIAPHHELVCPAPRVEVSDVCGAGDTFLAALVVEFLNTNCIAKSIHFANQAAAVTVQHIGVHAPTLEEIECV